MRSRFSERAQPRGKFPIIQKDSLASSFEMTMKFTTLALFVATMCAVAAVGYPILNRVQTNQQNAARRSQFASKLQSSNLAAIEQNNPRWFAAAQAFDKDKANVAAIFNGADKVEALRLFPVGSEKPSGQVAPYVPFFAKHTVDDAQFAARLGHIVLDAKSYALPGQSTTQCYIESAIAFRVWKKQQFADTVICFKCDQLAVLEHNNSAPKRSIGSLLQGRFNVSGDFIVRPQLLALTEEAFPNDGAVQSLN